MRMRLGRTARLAAAALTGGVLAAAAGCSGGGTSTGSAPPARTLAPDPGGGGHPAAAWPTYGRDVARSGVAAGVAAPGPLNVSWRVDRDLPAPDGQPRYDQQRPALTIGAGRVYVAFGGLAGDCGPYRGSVVGIPLSGSGPMISYVVPTPREGAVWATGGPVTGPDGTRYVSVGNGSETSTRFDGGDSVTALSPAP